MTTISELRNIIEYTRSLNNRDEKLEYLNTWDRNVLNFLAGNIRKDGIAKAIASEIPIVNESKISMEQIINTFNVATNSSKRKDKINLMKSILLTEEDRDFVLTCLFDSLKLGLKIPIPDPIFGETIKPALCGTGIEFDPKKFIIEQKFDGIRCLATNNNSKITLQSRNGKVLNIPIIERSLKNVLPIGMTIDGEIIDKSGDFQKLDRKSDNLIYMIFDIIFQYEKPIEISLHLRQRILMNHIYKDNNVKISYPLDLNTIDEINEWIESTGAEGIVAKDPNSLYKYGDRKSWIKVKPFLDCTCDVIGYTPGEGKRSGIMGAINVKPAGKSQVTKVGSGFTDEQLIEMKELIDGGNKILIDVKFQNWTTDGCLRFPVFLRIREINGEEI